MNHRKHGTTALGRAEHERIQIGLLVAAREEERKKIARELHDSVGQEMAALALQINSALNTCRRLGVKREVREVCETLLDSYERISHLTMRVGKISHLLHPSMLEQVGLPTALSGLCAETRALSGMRVHCTCSAQLPRIPFDVCLCLYRIAQEALHNICKHAKASAVGVTLSGAAGVIELRIMDNGCGFNRLRIGAHRGVGLISMQERAKSLRGDFFLKTEVGKGTEITVRLPTGD